MTRFCAHKLIDAIQDGTVRCWNSAAAEKIVDLEDRIITAQKFHAGHIDNLPPVRTKLWDLPPLRLPYPVTYIEFEVADVVICMLARESDENAILLDAVLFSEGEFLANGVTVVLREGTQTQIDHDLQDGGMSQAIGDQTLFFHTFLTALNCVNVVAVDNPPPPKLNRKRSVKGKTPLFSFKTLHLKPERKAKEATIQGGADRAGPRLHLRRGHIRRLDDKQIWVQPHMVGKLSRGMVLKDYELSRP